MVLERISLERPRRVWEGNIEMGYESKGCENME